MWRGVAVGNRVKFGDFRAGKRQKLLMWLDGCKIGLTRVKHAKSTFEGFYGF